jgi:GTP pyrophosphokinase
VRDLIPSLLNFRGKAALAPNTEPLESKVDAPRWLTELADAHAEVGGKEFVEGLKEDFFSHRVFVFTPNGDVIDLPYESTPVDFAYAIHSDLGDHMNGAKVNGKLVSLDTKLRNGDQVEIMHRDSAHPTKKWLEYAKTSLARRHIRMKVGAEEARAQEAAQPSQAKKKTRGVKSAAKR